MKSKLLLSIGVITLFSIQLCVGAPTDIKDNAEGFNNFSWRFSFGVIPTSIQTDETELTPRAVDTEIDDESKLVLDIALLTFTEHLLIALLSEIQKEEQMRNSLSTDEKNENSLTTINPSESESNESTEGYRQNVMSVVNI